MLFAGMMNIVFIGLVQTGNRLSTLKKSVLSVMLRYHVSLQR